MRFAFEVTGVGDVQTILFVMAARTSEATKTAVSKVLHDVERHERTMLSLGWHPKGTITGSIPPEPPWRISGALSRSVTVEEPHLTALAWEGKAGPKSKYGRIQELGGWTGRNHATYLPPRPHLRPAWEIVRVTAASTFVHAWEQSTRPRP